DPVDEELDPVDRVDAEGDQPEVPRREVVGELRPLDQLARKQPLDQLAATLFGRRGKLARDAAVFLADLRKQALEGDREGAKGAFQLLGRQGGGRRRRGQGGRGE